MKEMDEKKHLYWRMARDSEFRPEHHSRYCWCSIEGEGFKPQDMTTRAYYFWRPGPGTPDCGCGDPGCVENAYLRYGGERRGISETQSGHERATKPEGLR